MFRWPYIVYGFLMIGVVFICPYIEDSEHLRATLSFLKGEQYQMVLNFLKGELFPVLTSIVSLLVICLMAGILNSKSIKIISFGAVSLLALVVGLSGHWGIASMLGFVILGILGQTHEGKTRDERWRWIVMTILMLFSASFGLHGHWIISTVLAIISACLVFKN